MEGGGEFSQDTTGIDPGWSPYTTVGSGVPGGHSWVYANLGGIRNTGFITAAVTGTVAITLAASEVLASSAISQRLLWTSWANYPKVRIGGRTYARIGNRLYTRHAVDRMLPRALETGDMVKANQVGGRSISPNFVEDVIRNGTRSSQDVNGVTRTLHSSGSLRVVTEQNGRIVVTIENIHH